MLAKILASDSASNGAIWVKARVVNISGTTISTASGYAGHGWPTEVMLAVM